MTFLTMASRPKSPRSNTLKPAFGNGFFRCSTAMLPVFAFALVAGPYVDTAHAKKRMTCSFIAKQCKKECTKEVNEGFCTSYCGDERAACLKTGRWEGMVRKFSNVIKR
ncbi:MAG: hypothetical protein AAFV45_12245 [Pseudomonadota bacterium]